MPKLSRIFENNLQIRLELERAIINDVNQSDCPETAEYPDTSSNSIQQFSTLCKSYSTSDLALRLQKTQMFVLEIFILFKSKLTIENITNLLI